MDRERFPGLIRGIAIAAIISIIAIGVSDALMSALVSKLTAGTEIIDYIDDEIIDDDVIDDDTNDDTKDDDTNDDTDDDTNLDGKYGPHLKGSLQRYNLLNDEEKVIYKQIYNSLINVKDFDDTVKYSGKDKISDVLDKVSKYVIIDNPEIFYTFGADLITTIPTSNEGEYDAQLNYTFYVNKTQADKYLDQMYNRIDEILATNDFTGYTDFEKALWCYEWLCKNIEYNNDIVNDKDDKIKDKYIIWRAYGAFTQNSTVCMGYAEAFQMFMYKLDVECTTVSGLCGDSGHEWNVANIDGVNTHIDATWADQVTYISYEYFGQTTEQISKDKKKQDDDYWPECTSTEANYYVHFKNKQSFVVEPEQIKKRLIPNFNEIRHSNPVIITN